MGWEEKIFKNRPIRNKRCPRQPCLLMDRYKMCNTYRGPSIHASYQVTAHLAKQFQRRRFFRNQPIRNKNCLWRPCLLTNRDEMSHLYRGPSINASYHVTVHLAKRFQRRRCFRNQPIRNKNCLWQPCFFFFLFVSSIVRNLHSYKSPYITTWHGCTRIYNIIIMWLAFF